MRSSSSKGLCKLSCGGTGHNEYKLPVAIWGWRQASEVFRLSHPWIHLRPESATGCSLLIVTRMPVRTSPGWWKIAGKFGYEGTKHGGFVVHCTLGAGQYLWLEHETSTGRYTHWKVAESSRERIMTSCKSLRSKVDTRLSLSDPLHK